MSLKGFVFDQVQKTFGKFQGQIDNIVQVLIETPESFNPTVWKMVLLIHDTFLPIAYSLLALFFLVELTKKSSTVDITWEQIVKVLLKTCFLKVIIEKSFLILNMILSLSIKAVNSVNSVAGVSFNSPVLLDDIRKNINSMGTFELILYYVSIAPLSFVMDFIGIAITLIIIGRFFEIYIYTAIAPLPLSTMANEALNHTGKGFLQSYAAVCFQSVIILIGCKIYGGIVQSMAVSGTGSEALKNIVIISLLLLFLLIKSGSWAKKITGAT